MPLGRGGGVVGVGVPVGDNTPRVAYRGFISYSHKDAGLGRAIHRKLETYRLPKTVAGQESPRGIIPERLTPIFRDREELSAGESLSDQVQAALASSECLIVLCSPNAKASQWVAREIELFRQLHPDRPILAGLIAGEPADAFPDALTAIGAEPIAADFRKGGDGQRLALLKLVAGMTGTPLDALVQRDAQRQTRRVTAITLASLTAVLVMAALLVMAIRAQREAERQRQQAEGLVEYMLTDLRDRLKGVGRLDVMTAVNERAMGYYGGESMKGQLLRARTLHALGEDHERRGKIELAAQNFAEARRMTAAALATNPKDAEAIFAHAQSEYWVGRIRELRSEWVPALAQYQRYEALAAQLIQIDPKSPSFMMEMAWGIRNQANIELRGFDQPAKARGHASASLQWFERALLAKPEDKAIRSEIAETHAWIADTYFAEENLEASVQHRQAQVAKRLSLVSDFPGDNEQRYLLADAHYALGANLAELRRFKEAKSELGAAAQDYGFLRRVDPNNAVWRHQTALVASKEIVVDYSLGNLSGARRAADLATTLASEAKARRDPRADWLSQQISTRRKRAGL